MYNYIKGMITEIKSTSITVDNNGIGYEIYTPNPYAFEEGKEYKVYVYQYIREDEISLYGFKNSEEKELPDNIKEGDILKSNDVETLQKFTKPAPRYTEATLIEEMEKLGIGRPSTYASTSVAVGRTFFTKSIFFIILSPFFPFNPFIVQLGISHKYYHLLWLQ